jgi:Arc/MetJ-type ribon-helix-helix transcriptional regulator
MASESERISVRLPKETIEKIEKLLSTGKYGRTISDFVRRAIDAYIDAEFTPENVEKKVIELPKANIEVLEEATKRGEYVSIDDAIRDVIREYVRKRLEESDR